MASLIRNADIAPDAAIASTKLAAWATNRSAGGFKLTNLANGTASTDAVNKGQLDAATSGAVTAISIASANGISGSSSGGATPILTLALGAITPSSVAASGSVTGSNLSGINTGDQIVPVNTIGTATQFFSAYNSATGTFTKTQPAFSDISGSVAAAQMPALTGDVTTSAGTVATTIADGAVTTVKMANIPGWSVLGKITNATGAPQAVTASTDGHVLRLSGLNLGFGTIATAGITDASVTLAKMANVVTASVFYRKTSGTGAPEVNTLATLKTDLSLTGTNSGDQTITLTGDVTSGAMTTGSFATTIAANAVTTTKILDSNITYAKIQNVSATNRLLGRSTAGAGIIEEITVGIGLSLSGGTLTTTDSGGTVTDFSAGDLSPLFTTTEATTTTTPALSFVLSTAPANTFFGNGTGSTATPTFMSASTARTSLGGTTVGQAFFTLTDPSVITFPRINANNSVSALDAATFRTAIGAGTGSGTVTSVGINPVNGISGSSSGGAAPVLTITLGAITPSSVAATGVVSGSNLSGTNTGDQSLTGDVTASGTGAMTATIAANAVTTAKILDDAVTLAKMANIATASFIGRNTAGTGDPEVLSVSTVSSMLNLSGLYQPLDGDLTSLASASNTHAIYYRSGTDTWNPVRIGTGLVFNGSLLSAKVAYDPTGAATLPSTATLDLSSTPDPFIDVTGTTNISAITLADGEIRTLRFTGAGLTLVKGSSLLTPGGVDLTTTANGFAVVSGAAGGVVTVSDYQNAAGYSVQTFDNIFMNAGANIRSTTGSSQFDIGKKQIGSGGSYWHFATDPALVQNDDFSNQALFNIDDLSGSYVYRFPDGGGTFATQAGAESLTNKKLGSLTSNGFVKTSGGDGTLSVDTATYLTSAAIGSTIQAFDSDLSSWAAITRASGFDTFTATPSSANLAALVTGETGSGALVFGTSPTLTTPVINGISTGTGVDTAATADALVLRDSIGDVYVSALYAAQDVIATHAVYCDVMLQGGDTTAATATPITLTYQSRGAQIVTGTSTNTTFNLPVASGLSNGWGWRFRNEQTGTGTVVIKTSGGNTLVTVAPGTEATVTVKNNGGGTGTASWSFTYNGLVQTTATKLTVTTSLTLSGTTGTTMTFPSTNATIARTDAANTFTGVQTMTSPALTTPAITGLATGSGVASAATASTLVARDASGDITGNRLIAGAQIRLKGYTVAGLPAGTQGDTAFATDLLAPGFLVAAVGGGTVVGPVFYNGTAWVAY